MSPALLLVLSPLRLVDRNFAGHAVGLSGDQKFDPYGELRLLASLPPRDLQLDTEGTMLGQDFVLDSRLRTGPAVVAFGRFRRRPVRRPARRR